MRLVVENERTSVVDLGDREKRDLDALLRARPRGFQFDPRYKRRQWDGYYHAYNFRSFPTGCLETVLGRYPDSILEDRRGASTDPRFLRRLRSPPGGTPRPDQLDAARDLLSFTLRGLPWPRGVVRFGTAGGKTYILATCLASVPVKSLVLVHRKGLLNQTAKVLERLLKEKVGRVGDGIAEFDRRVTVATVQTLVGLPSIDFMTDVEALYVDECQRAGAPTFHTVIARLTNAYIRAGFSATPYDKTNPAQILRVMGLFGFTRHAHDAKALIAEGIIAKPTIFFRKVSEPVAVPWGGRRIPSYVLPWKAETGFDGVVYTPAAYDALITNNDARNRMIADFVAQSDKVTLVLVSRLEHGTVLAAMLGAPFIAGEDSTKTRTAFLDALRQKDCRCLVASTILDEGEDVPSIKRLVLAGGGLSEIRTLQRIGRGMRKDGEDATLTVLDFLDGTNPHLAKHSKARVLAAAEAGYTIRMDGETPS